MKTSTKWIIAIVVLIIIAAVVYYYYWYSPAQTAAANQAASQKTPAIDTPAPQESAVIRPMYVAPVNNLLSANQ